VTRRLRKDGSAYYGPYFPANLAYRIVDLIHRTFLVPSCKVDLTRNHPRPCLQFYIKRCLGPCVKDLTTPEIYAEAVRDVKLFLEGRQTDLAKSLRERMSESAEAQEFERAARIATWSPPSSSCRRSSASPPPKATTPTSSAITTKIKCWP
jgi:excinuclease ABC subunit C